MDDKDLRVLKKMLEYTNSISEYSKDIHSVDELKNHKMVAEAVCFDILQIGELANRGLSNDCKNELPNIPWPLINGLRNRIVHGYNYINWDVVYETVQDDIKTLGLELEKIIRENY